MHNSLPNRRLEISQYHRKLRCILLPMSRTRHRMRAKLGFRYMKQPSGLAYTACRSFKLKVAGLRRHNRPRMSALEAFGTFLRPFFRHLRAERDVASQQNASKNTSERPKCLKDPAMLVDLRISQSKKSMGLIDESFACISWASRSRCVSLALGASCKGRSLPGSEPDG